ncbi:MAG: hypothetical protein KDB22_02410 [Planctomycetales bacterium]|nr:hypothetical protein [Planctomycetales bacterium]
MKNYLIFVAFLVHAANANSHEPPLEAALDSFNYWELSFQVLRSEVIRDALQVAPWQDAAIRNMRSGEKMHSLFNKRQIESLVQKAEDAKQLEIAEDLEKSLRGMPTTDRVARRDRERVRMQRVLSNAATGRTATLLSMDSEVQGELRKILTKEQMSQLRPTVMRLKFSKGYLPFEDKEFIEFCGLSDADLRLLNPQVLEAKIQYEAQVSQVRSHHAKQVLNVLPPAALQLFLDYIGNSLVPNVTIKADSNVTSIPFPPLSQLATILGTPDLQKTIKVSETQLVQLRGIHEKYLSDVREPPKGKSMTQQIEQAEAFLRKAAEQVLTSEQSLALARQRALESFLRDYSAPFAQAEIADNYLTLTKDEAEEIRKFAAEEMRIARKTIRELDQEVFRSLSAKLNDDARKRSRDLFEGVWTIDLPVGIWVQM